MADDLSTLTDKVNNIISDLGPQPQGIYANVRVRLDILETRVGSGGSGGGGGGESGTAQFLYNPVTFNAGNPDGYGVSIAVGTGAPSVSANFGSLYLRTDGTYNTGLYSYRPDGYGWTAIGKNTLYDVLSFGNTTSGRNIVLSAGDAITGSNGQVNINANGAITGNLTVGTVSGNPSATIGDFKFPKTLSMYGRNNANSADLLLFDFGNISLDVLTLGNTSQKLNLRGNTIDVNSTKIVNLTNPTANQDAATKFYVDSSAKPSLKQVLNTGNQTDGYTITVSSGDVINIIDAPTLGSHAVNKSYVDGYVASYGIASGTAAGGDLTGTYPNPNVGANKITLSKIQTIITDSLLGRDTAGTGNVENIGLNVTLSMDGSGNLQRSALTGDVTAAAGSNTTTITTNAVTDSKIRQSSALSIIGRSANSTGNVADISTTSSSDAVLRESGGVLGFGTIATGGIANNAVTVAKIQNITTDSLLGRDSFGTGNVEVITLNTTLSMDGYNALQRSALTGDITAAAGSNTTTITSNAVTDVKIRQSAALSVIGRSANSTGNVSDISTTSSSDAVLRESGGVLGFGTIASGGIANNAVTFSKIQTIVTDSLLGRDSFGTGNVENIGLNATLSMDGSGNLQRSALTGDVTAAAGSNTTTLGINVVTNGKFRQSGGLSVVGRSANLTGDVADISATPSSNAVLRESGGVLSFGTVATAGIANNAITDGKLRQSAALAVIGRSANSTGDVADITTTASSDAVLRESGGVLGFGTIAAGAFANNAITDAKFRQSSALSIVGRSANSTGNVADISTTSSSDAVLRESGGTLGFGTIATGGIANNAVTDAKIRQSSGLSIVGRSANSTGNVADITAISGSGGILRESGGVLGFGTISFSAVNGTLKNVLAQSNRTDGYNIIVDTTDYIDGYDGYTRINNHIQIGGVVKIAERSSLVTAQSGYGKLAILQASGDGYQLPRPVALMNDGYTAQVLSPFPDYDFSKQTTNNTLLQALNLTLADNTLYSIGIRITAKQSSSSNVLVRESTGLVHRISGGNATILGNFVDSNYYRSDTNWASGLTVSGTSFLITVTGVAATTINWRIQVWLSSVGYP